MTFITLNRDRRISLCADAPHEVAAGRCDANSKEFHRDYIAASKWMQSVWICFFSLFYSSDFNTHTKFVRSLTYSYLRIVFRWLRTWQWTDSICWGTRPTHRWGRRRSVGCWCWDGNFSLLHFKYFNFISIVSFLFNSVLSISITDTFILIYIKGVSILIGHPGGVTSQWRQPPIPWCVRRMRGFVFHIVLIQIWSILCEFCLLMDSFSGFLFNYMCTQDPNFLRPSYRPLSLFSLIHPFSYFLQPYLVMPNNPPSFHTYLLTIEVLWESEFGCVCKSEWWKYECLFICVYMCVQVCACVCAYNSLPDLCVGARVPRPSCSGRRRTSLRPNDFPLPALGSDRNLPIMEDVTRCLLLSTLKKNKIKHTDAHTDTHTHTHLRTLRDLQSLHFYVNFREVREGKRPPRLFREAGTLWCAWGCECEWVNGGERGVLKRGKDERKTRLEANHSLSPLKVTHMKWYLFLSHTQRNTNTNTHKPIFIRSVESEQNCTHAISDTSSVISRTTRLKRSWRAVGLG